MAITYRITQLGRPDRGGADTPITAEIGGLAKTNDRNPYTITNEVVCEHIGRCLGLPVPDGILARDATGKLYFLSLDASFEGKSLPPIIASDFVEAEPNLAAGCLAFDILVANTDRHAENLSRDAAFDPPRVTLFDHGGALMGSALPNGVARLHALRDELGCESPVSRHVLLDELRDSDHLEAWVTRIEALPPYVFEDAVSRASAEPDTSLPSEDKEALVEWLTTRARNLRSLIRSHADRFPKVATWGLLWEGGT